MTEYIVMICTAGDARTGVDSEWRLLGTFDYHCSNPTCPNQTECAGAWALQNPPDDVELSQGDTLLVDPAPSILLVQHGGTIVVPPYPEAN